MPTKLENLERDTIALICEMQRAHIKNLEPIYKQLAQIRSWLPPPMIISQVPPAPAHEQPLSWNAAVRAAARIAENEDEGDVCQEILKLIDCHAPHRPPLRGGWG